MTVTHLPVTQPRRIDTAEQAKLVRARLKARFPGQQFWVRIDRFSMGSSVDVYWLDGPPESDVQEVLNQYRGGSFDGMIDLAYNYDSWLNPDGTAQIAHSRGTVGSRGVDPEIITDPPHPNAELVSFSSSYLDAHRYTLADAAKYFPPKRGPYVPKEGP